MKTGINWLRKEEDKILLGDLWRESNITRIIREEKEIRIRKGRWCDFCDDWMRKGDWALTSTAELCDYDPKTRKNKRRLVTFYQCARCSR